MNLFIICNDYPFGIGEPYFENEMIVNESKFNKIYLVIPEFDINASKQLFYLPANAVIVPLNIKEGLSKPKAAIKAFLSTDFYEELFAILFKYRQLPTLARLKTLINYYAKSEVFIDRFSKEFIGNITKGDVLYTYWCTEYTYAISKIKAGLGTKAITRIHGWDVYYERSINNYLPLRGAIFKRLDAIYTVSENGRKYLLNKTSDKFSEKIKTAYLGTLDGNYIDTPKSTDLHIFSLSNIVPVKQLSKIIDALVLINDVHIIWTHIGGGDGLDEFTKEAKSKLKDKANIRYELLGSKHKAEVYQLLTNSGYHCLVNTSNYEGLPVSFMEALSFGIPIIAPNVGGIPEIVEHGVNGFLTEVRPGPQAIANAIRQMAKVNAQEYDAMRKNAYKVWETKFNAAKNYTEFAADLATL